MLDEQSASTAAVGCLSQNAPWLNPKLFNYASLAARYVRDFDGKWLEGGAPPGEALVGGADIQSLADLGNSYDVVQSMRIVPVSSRTIVVLVGVTLVPVAPLLLTLMPMEERVNDLFGILF